MMATLESRGCTGTRKPENPNRKIITRGYPNLILTSGTTRIRTEPQTKTRGYPKLFYHVLFREKSPDFRSKIEITLCKSTL